MQWRAGAEVTENGQNVTKFHEISVSANVVHVVLLVIEETDLLSSTVLHMSRDLLLLHTLRLNFGFLSQYRSNASTIVSSPLTESTKCFLGSQETSSLH